MAEIDQTADTNFNLCWARGDDDPRIFTIKSGGVVVPISGQTFSMAVNSDKDPVGTAAEIFQVLGVFVTDGLDGKISFTPPSGSLDNVAAKEVAYYDVNRITPSKKTLLKGKVIFVMDVDKT